MSITRKQARDLLVRAQQSGHLSQDGPTSLFFSPRSGAFSRRPVQLAVRVCGDTVTVRTSRLPFVKPFVFTRSELVPHVE